MSNNPIRGRSEEGKPLVSVTSIDPVTVLVEIREIRVLFDDVYDQSLLLPVVLAITGSVKNNFLWRALLLRVVRCPFDLVLLLAGLDVVSRDGTVAEEEKCRAAANVPDLDTLITRDFAFWAVLAHVQRPLIAYLRGGKLHLPGSG